MLAAVAVVGIGAALWSAKPSWQLGAVEVVFAAWIPASAMMLARYSSGKTKAWWIGIAAECTFTAIVCNLAILSTYLSQRGVAFENLFDFPFFYAQYALLRLSFCLRQVLMSWAFAPVVGLLCVFTHWFLIRPTGPKD